MKSLLKVIVVLIVILVAVVGGALFYIDSIAKKAIEVGGSQALGVPTTLQGINISLFGGEVVMNGLNVGNPPGFKSDRFLSLGLGEVAVSLASLTGDTVTVPKVRLANIKVNLEQDGKKNNVQPLLQKARSAAGSGQGNAKSAPAAEGDGKKFIIEHFTIENVQVAAQLALLGEASKVNLVLPKIELKNLGAEQGGMSVEELVQTVVQTILDAVASSSGSLAPQLAALLRGELKGLDTVKGEFIGKAGVEIDKAAGQLQQQLDKVNLPAGADKGVQEKADKAIKGIKGLFGGDKK
jgi:uncharacterized protein involved in outer membrane biogenesis